MEKIAKSVILFGIGVVAFGLNVLPQKLLTFENVGMFFGSIFAVYVGIKILSKVPQLLMWTALVAVKGGLRASLYFGSRIRALTIMVRNIVVRATNNIFVINWLFKNNRNLQVEIYRLRSEVQDLNSELRDLINHWSPHNIPEQTSVGFTASSDKKTTSADVHDLTFFENESFSTRVDGPSESTPIAPLQPTNQNGGFQTEDMQSSIG
jgi:hypothetical protein